MQRLDSAQQALAERVTQRGDHFYPNFHLAPPAGWMNDPNGLIYFNGRYHAFYQHHPFSVDWGPMHWGHATSTDMVSWTHQPIALAPDSEADRDGCFSGSAVDYHGQLALIYTGHCWLGEPGDDSQIREVQCLALSQDGIHFEKQGVVLTPPAGVMHFRDPKVWFEAESWWMVIGARDAANHGQVLLYRGENLTDWHFDRILAEAGPAEGYMWECPDFFPIGQQQYLLCSPQGIERQADNYANLYQSGVIAGEWQPGGDFIRKQPFIELDAGHDYYAPQSFTAADGRRIVMAWMDMWESPMPSKQEGWCGCMTLPRQLSEHNGQLIQQPVAEIEKLRTIKQSITPQTISESVELVATGTGLELKIDWQLSGCQAQRFGLRLGSGVQLFVEPAEQRLTLARDYPEHGLVDQRTLIIESLDTVHWHIFIDRSSLEIFINHGTAVMTSRIYPLATDSKLSLFSHGGETQLLRGDYWRLQA